MFFWIGDPLRLNLAHQFSSEEVLGLINFSKILLTVMKFDAKVRMSLNILT